MHSLFLTLLNTAADCAHACKPSRSRTGSQACFLSGLVIGSDMSRLVLKLAAVYILIMGKLEDDEKVGLWGLITDADR